MPNLSLKYNQAFRKSNLVEDMFEDVEGDKKGDDNILSLNSRSSDTTKDNDKEEKTTNRKGYLLFSLFFGLIIFFVIFVILILSNYNKKLVLDFYSIMKV